MGPETKPLLIHWAIAASAVFHVGAVAGVAAFPHHLPNADAVTSEVEFVVLPAQDVEEPALPDLEPLPPPEPAPRLATSTPTLPDALFPRPTIIEPALEPLDPNEDEVPENPEPTEAPERPRSLVSLDPASVAAAAVIFDDTPAPRTGNHAAAAAPSDQSREEAMEAALSGALSAAANARPHVSRRPPPRLRPSTDGTYSFHGHLFDAQISADGTVSFADRGGVQADEFSLSRPDGLLPSGSFDISDAIEGARGQDPYRHERAWFMRETRELRERLADQAQAHVNRRGMARLGGHLRRIWRGRGSARERRAQLFEQWDDCSEDGIGDAARAAILSFVQRELPAGSASAFSAAEITELNRRRRSRERFVPY